MHIPALVCTVSRIAPTNVLPTICRLWPRTSSPSMLLTRREERSIQLPVQLKHSRMFDNMRLGTAFEVHVRSKIRHCLAVEEARLRQPLTYVGVSCKSYIVTYLYIFLFLYVRTHVFTLAIGGFVYRPKCYLVRSNTVTAVSRTSTCSNWRLNDERKRRGRRHDFLVNHDDYAIFVRAISPKETVVSHNWFKEGQISDLLCERFQRNFSGN